MSRCVTMARSASTGCRKVSIWWLVVSAALLRTSIRGNGVPARTSLLTAKTKRLKHDLGSRPTPANHHEIRDTQRAQKSAKIASMSHASSRLTSRVKSQFTSIVKNERENSSNRSPTDHLDKINWGHTYAGNLAKMKASVSNDHNQQTLQYTLVLGNHTLPINDLIGHPIRIRFRGVISCVECGAVSKKAYGQGFCFKCFTSSPRAAECIIRPELCQAHLGIGRDVDWEKNHHNTTHVVYLALSSKLKVGVTRCSDLPTRWIDQGATSAIVIARVPYRQLAGLLEKHLKRSFGDKTPWQRMLKGETNSSVCLFESRSKAHGLIQASTELKHLKQYLTRSDEICRLEYPISRHPKSPKSVNLFKTHTLQGVLAGVKGQYLIFNDDRVINIRSHTGFSVQVDVGGECARSTSHSASSLRTY